MLNKNVFKSLILNCYILVIILADRPNEYNHPLVSSFRGDTYSMEIMETTPKGTRYVIIDITAAAPLFWLLLIPIGAVVFCWCVYRCCRESPRSQSCVTPQSHSWTRSDADNPDLVQCYLCFAKVSTALWKSGQHRMECSTRFNHKLQAMPRSRSVFCLSCGEKMRQWPWQGPEFACDSGVSNVCFSSEGKIIANTGGNRFNCFICDVDYCKACVHSMECFRKYNYNTFSFPGETSQVPAPRAATLSSPSIAIFDNSNHFDESPPSYSEAMKSY